MNGCDRPRPAGPTSRCASPTSTPSIAWYEAFTPLTLLDRRQDDLGFGAWLGQPDSADRPFVLVLAQFLPATDPFRRLPEGGAGTVRPPRHRAAGARATSTTSPPGRGRRLPGDGAAEMPTPSATSARSATPTATWSSSRSTRACTPRPARSGAGRPAGVEPAIVRWLPRVVRRPRPRRHRRARQRRLRQRPHVALGAARRAATSTAAACPASSASSRACATTSSR